MNQPLFGECEECGQICTGIEWCNSCNAKHFQENFINWTSGNNDIDEFIQDIQLSAICNEKVLEWIPYDKFNNIKYIAEGGFGKVYKANWIDGCIDKWNKFNQIWDRSFPNRLVALKSINNSQNVTLAFFHEITSHHKIIEEGPLFPNIVQFYGMTQDPETKNYIMVLEYAMHGSLRDYLNQSYKHLDWKHKFYDLYSTICGLDQIHKQGLIHRDLHIGNVLKTSFSTLITDMGLCKPVNYSALEVTKNVYGVLPYMAPEVLRGRDYYTKAADIYSFGIIMYEVISGSRPYHHDRGYGDQILAIRICRGLRPTFNIKLPELILHLIKQCLDADPLKRPTSEEIKNTLLKWYRSCYYSSNAKICLQINEAEESNSKLSVYNISTGSETHSEDSYISRLYNFDNLPKPKNPDDYYEHYDNISNYKDSLHFLQINIKISDAEKEEKEEKEEKLISFIQV